MGSDESHELTFPELFALSNKIVVVRDHNSLVHQSQFNKPSSLSAADPSCACYSDSQRIVVDENSTEYLAALVESGRSNDGAERLSWYNANNVYPTSGSTLREVRPLNPEFLATKYRLQNLARRALRGGDWRLHRCIWTPVGEAVSVNYAPDFKRAHYGGLTTCASVWVCPVCSIKIAARRGAELVDAIPASNLTPILVTYTIQHKRDDLLDELISDLNAGIRYSLSGAAKKRFFERFGIVGYVTALEIRHGKNGWHPHKHRLFLSDRPASELNSAEIEKSILSRYGKYLRKKSYRVNKYTTDVQVVEGESGAAVESYLTKWSAELELTGGALKTSRAAAASRSPFQLLDAFGSGDQEAAVKFIEYAEATRGKKQLQFSDGLRKHLGLDVQKSDEELAAEQSEVARVLSKLSRPEWYRLRRQRGLIAQVLHVGSFADSFALTEFLKFRGVIID